MKLVVTHQDGTQETLELTGPLKIVPHPSRAMELLHDEGTGVDYWFDVAHGNLYFNGSKCSIQGCDLTIEEKKALITGLKELSTGNKRPLSEVEEDLSNKAN